MLTFDSTPGQGNELDALFGEKPDVIECGENNDYWIRVVRSLGKVEFVSKQTGFVVMRTDLGAPEFLPVTAAQLGAIRDALKL